ncbi:MAG: peptidase U32 family protein [Bacteroidales bacterium]
MKAKAKDNHIEIMAPAGSFEALAAAIEAGAGSVYFGTGHLNMRSASSQNFSLDDLESIADKCHSNGVRSYITLNTVVYDHELAEMRQLIEAAKANNISAVIASDMAVIRYARQQGMEVHMSTQTNISNIEAVRYYSRFADVMVMARELNLNQVKAITDAIEQQHICGPSGQIVKVEMFVHGALCMAISGKCYLSLDMLNASANRGACLQPCRRAYQVKDKNHEVVMEIDNAYIMSPKDLKTVDFLDKILKAGVKVLKIEGRGRSPEYVKTVVEVYTQAVQAYVEDTFSHEKVEKWDKRLRTVYNRGFWEGYYLGRKRGEWTEKPGSRATKKKIYVGKVTNYFAKIKVAEIQMQSGHMSVGDELLIIGPTTGVQQVQLTEIRVDMKPVASAVKGSTCSVPVNSTVRRSDKVYKLMDEDPDFGLNERYD